MSEQPWHTMETLSAQQLYEAGLAAGRADERQRWREAVEAEIARRVALEAEQGRWEFALAHEEVAVTLRGLIADLDPDPPAEDA